MPDRLNFDEKTMASLMPEQRLMAAIVRRAFIDLPLSRSFFQPENGMFMLCCEALGMDPREVRAQVANKLRTKTEQMLRIPSASAV